MAEVGGTSFSPKRNPQTYTPKEGQGPFGKALQQTFSRKVADRISAPQRSSTRSCYEARWKIFLRWAGDRDVNPDQPMVEQLADFLLFLFEEKRLQPWIDL